jgi:hypothetical protein
VYPGGIVTSRQPLARTRPLDLAARMAAFFAVALLTLAGVKATVMQAQADSAPPMTVAMACPDMPGMGDMAKGNGDAGHKTTAATCPFCIAAAHVPLQSLAEPIPAPACVAWIAPPLVSDHSPRGPPRVQPKARGPPASLQIV